MRVDPIKPQQSERVQDRFVGEATYTGNDSYKVIPKRGCYLKSRKYLCLISYTFFNICF